MKQKLDNTSFGKLREFFNSDLNYWVYCPSCAKEYLEVDPEVLASKVNSLRWFLLMKDGACNYCGGEEVVVSEDELDSDKL